jgi:hypothetical protein
MRLLRLFNQPEGKRHLQLLGLPTTEIEDLSLLGISCIGNLLAAIKTAKYFELGPRDVVMTVWTDSVELYRSRLDELRNEHGSYSPLQAAADLAGPLLHQGIDYFKELGYHDRKAIHNLKYYTWVEQQGKSVEELAAQWDPEYWRALFEDEVEEFDRLITAFNSMAAERRASS